MAAFAQFGSDLDKATQEQLANGERLQEILKQGQYQPMTAAEQVVSIYAATPQAGRKSWVRDLGLGDIRRFEQELIAWMRTEQKALLAKIAESGQLGEAEDKALAAALDQFANNFQPSRKLE